MAIEATVVTIATGIGTTQVDVAHGMSQTPQLAILMHAGTGSGGLDMRLAMGAFTSATERFGVTMFAEQGATTMDSACLLVTDGCLPLLSNVTTVDGQLDAVGFDATNVSVIPDNGFGITKNISCFLAAGLTNVKVGTITLGAATGAQSFTGVGFAPDVILFIGTSGVAAGTIATHARWASGWSTVTANRALALNSRDNVADSQTDGIISDDYAWVSLAATTGAVSDGFTVTSFDSDGFTINKSVGANTPLIGYIAMKGCQAKVVDSAFRTDTSNQSVSVTDFAPLAVLSMFRPGVTASEEGTASTTLTGGFGWGVSSSARYSCWVGEEDAQAASDVYAKQDATKLVHSFDVATGATTQGSMDIVTLDTTTTLDQVLAGTALTYLPLLFLGDAASTGPSNPSVDNASTGLRRSARRMVAIGD